jgi:RNA polymerase sigma-70 factor (ECF subfamily)
LKEDIEQLIQKCIQQDRDSQFKLFEWYVPYVSSICHRYLRRTTHKEDVIQEIFLLVFKNISTFDIQKGPFKAWIRKIAINACLKWNQSIQSFTELDAELALSQLTTLPDLLSERDLIHIIQQIPDAYRDVFTLHVVDGYQHQDIAEILRISQALSRKKLQRARAFLKKHLELKKYFLLL